MKVAVQYPVFLILIPILAAVVIITSRDLRISRKLRKNMIKGIRIALLACIVCAMADISVSISAPETDTIFLLDVSDSFMDSREEAANLIKSTLSKMPKHNRAGVIAFGADTKIEQFMSDANLFMGVDIMPVSSATNIEKAVKAGLTLFNDAAAKRIVLITDGGQNEGDIESMSRVLTAGHVEVNVLKMENSIGEEVYVSDVTVPEKIQAGDTFKVYVTVESNVKTNATLQLYAGKKLSRQENVTLKNGTNSFIFKDTRRKAGFAEYKAVIIPEKDTLSINNEYSAYTEAGRAEKILLLEGEKNETDEFQKVLSAANIKYDVFGAESAPSDLDAMNDYKCIIIENTDIDSLPKGFTDNIESYVKDYGGGFAAIGGKKSFALGGYKDTVIEDILPVNMDISQDKKIPEMAMVMVIDKSGSMSDYDNSLSKLDMAKDAAASAVDNLRDTDSVGVIAFDDTYGWKVRIQKASDKEDIKSNIYGIAEGGGTSIFPAVNEAYNEIKSSDCQIKHIILLTDGQDGFYEGYPGLIEKLEKSNVTLSTVSIGTDADDNFLNNLADAGGGRFYNTEEGSELSRIFAQEIYLAQKEYIVNRVFTPNIINTGDILGEEISEGLPAMAGYIATGIKDKAMQVLTSDEDNDPVLACWQYGLGRTAAFTSDITNQWTGNYALWEEYPNFWKSIVNWLTDIAVDEGSTVNISQEGNSGKIVYTSKDYSSSTEVEVTCSDREGNASKIKLSPKSPGVYEGSLELNDAGIYTINVTQKEDGEIKDLHNARLAMQYSQEYIPQKDTDVLDSFVNQTGAAYIENLDGIFDSVPEEVISQRNITLPLLIITVVLFLIDVVYRRLDIQIGKKITAKFGSRFGSFNIKRNLERNVQKETSVNLDMAESIKANIKSKENVILESDKKADIQSNKKEVVQSDEKAKKAAAKKKSGKEKKAEKTKKVENEMLDVASLLKKQKERER